MDSNRLVVSRAGPALREPVSLEVPVRLQAEAGELSRFSEDTQTVLVFPEGAVLRVAAPLEPGQRVLLTNRWTRQQRPCRVVYARENRAVKGYVEVEFALPAPGFWEGTAPGPVINDPFGELPLVARNVEEPPATAAVGIVHDPLEKLTTIAETPEHERPVARHVTARSAQSVPTSAPPAPVAAVISHPPLPPAAAAIPAVGKPLVPDIETLLLARRADQEAAEGFSTRVLHPPAVAFFPTRRPRSRRPWYLGAAAALLVMTLGTLGMHAGGLWLGPPPAPPPPTPPSWVVPPVELPALSLYEMPFRPPRARELMALAPGARLRNTTRRGLVQISGAAPLPARWASSQPAEAALPDVGSAPAAMENSGALSALSVSSTTPSLPAPIPAVESQLRPLRLVLSVRPVYPPLAMKMRKQGDVVVQATIDETGKPTDLKVRSGPPQLHQAALDALVQWRYEPATLNGKPVAVTTAVTIRFQL